MTGPDIRVGSPARSQRSFMPYRAIVFDLFRTVIMLGPAAPTMKTAHPSWRTAMAALQAPALRVAPGLPFERFVDALAEVSAEIAQGRGPQHLEVPAADRYRRALARIGFEPDGVDDMARQLSLLQMERFAQHAHLPSEHRDLLENLAGRYRLGLVSNFDYAPVIHELLRREGIEDLFGTILISAEIGRRKPHPLIFAEALRRLEVSASEALFVGDSPVEDIGGASDAGMDTAWVNPSGMSFPEATSPPTIVIGQLPELRTSLVP